MSRLTLQAPLIISSRLLPAVRVGDEATGGTISLDPADLTWYIDTAEGFHDVQGGEFHHPHWADQSDDVYVRSAMAALLGFLNAFAEAHHPTWGGEDSECWALFPVEIGEWAYLNNDEIAMAAAEIENEDDERMQCDGCGEWFDTDETYANEDGTRTCSNCTNARDAAEEDA